MRERGREERDRGAKAIGTKEEIKMILSPNILLIERGKHTYRKTETVRGTVTE